MPQHLPNRTLLVEGAKISRAMHFNEGYAQRCPYKHVKAEQTRGRTPARSPSEGGKGSGKVCSIRRVLARTGRTAYSCTRTPVRLSRPGDGDKGGKPRSPSSKRRRPSKKRGKSAEKAAACCLSTTATLTGVSLPPSGTRFALAARKGEANKRDHWVVDENKGTCARIHQKFRACL